MQALSSVAGQQTKVPRFSAQKGAHNRTRGEGFDITSLHEGQKGARPFNTTWTPGSSHELTINQKASNPDRRTEGLEAGQSITIDDSTFRLDSVKGGKARLTLIDSASPVSLSGIKFFERKPGPMLRAGSSHSRETARGQVGMLVLTRQSDETIIIGDNIRITIVEVRGDKVRIGIDAPHDVPVHRQEIYDAIRREAENKAGENPPK